MKVGWIKTSGDPSVELGIDEKSFAFDGLAVSSEAQAVYFAKYE